MSTNYYVAENRCDCCQRYDRIYHIGKSSSGWSFSFRGYRSFKGERLSSWQEWKEFLRECLIVDEYGNIVSFNDFCTLVETVKAPNYINKNGHRNLQHNEEGKNKIRPWFNPMTDWDDSDGYAFTSKEFS